MNKNEMNHGGLDGHSCYAAFRARDSRFDGRFFIGISSTGIYCRPICRVRLPKQENCTYYASAAAAEAAGYRPCLRCRPELAPGHSQMEALSRTARKATLMMEEEWLSDHSLSELAAKLGITDRHLRRSFAAEYGVSPVQFLQTRRLLLAKNLLTDTNLSITEVAMATGFGSIRRFNDLFKKQYRLTPSSFRKQKSGAEEDGPAAEAPGESSGESFGELLLSLGYRPPYAWERLLRFLAAQAVPGVEEVQQSGGGAYLRAVALEGGGRLHKGWIKVENRPAKNALALTLTPSLLPVLPKLLARVRSLFDLNSSPADIHEQLRDMDNLAPGLSEPGTRLPGSFEIFETAVSALLRRWQSRADDADNGAASSMGRLAEKFGTPVETPFPALRFAFPEAAALRKPDAAGREELTESGAELFAMTEALLAGGLDLTPGADPEEALEKLLDPRGPALDSWSAQYLVMRTLGWTDAFPGVLPEDLAGVFPPPRGEAARRLQKELGGEAFRKRAQAWRPWRAYASMNLWDFFTAGDARQKGAE